MIMFCQWKARMVCSCNGHAMFAVWSYCAHLMPDATYIPWIVPYHHTTKPPYHHTTIPPYRHTTLPPYRHDGMIWFVKWYGMVYRSSLAYWYCCGARIILYVGTCFQSSIHSFCYHGLLTSRMWYHHHRTRWTHHKVQTHRTCHAAYRIPGTVQDTHDINRKKLRNHSGWISSYLVWVSYCYCGNGSFYSLFYSLSVYQCIIRFIITGPQFIKCLP